MASLAPIEKPRRATLQAFGVASADRCDGKNWIDLISDGTALFRVFLKSEFAEENLDFVLKVQKYREASPKKRNRMAWKLYRNYVAIGAPHELNLDIMSRKVTDLSMITPHMSTFDASQKRIYNMLENDAYQRFLQWHIYLQLVQEYDDQNPELQVEVDDSGCYNESTL